MSIEAISFIPAIAIPDIQPLATASSNAQPASAFGSWFEQQLTEVNTKIVEADQGAQRLAAGDASNLHQVMINLQEARMSLQLMMQVRNHLLDAYHDIAQMQL